ACQRGELLGNGPAETRAMPGGYDDRGCTQATHCRAVSQGDVICQALDARDGFVAGPRGLHYSFDEGLGVREAMGIVTASPLLLLTVAVMQVSQPQPSNSPSYWIT